MLGTSDNERLSTTEVAEEGTVDETQQSNSWSAVFMFVPFIFLVILLLFVVIEWARSHSLQLSGGGVHSSCVERHPAVECRRGIGVPRWLCLFIYLSLR